MKKASFVVWLYITAVCALVIAIGDKSFGWLLGSVVLFFVARMARRKFSEERETGHQGTSGRFMIWAFAVLLGGMFVLYKLQTAG